MKGPRVALVILVLSGLALVGSGIANMVPELIHIGGEWIYSPGIAGLSGLTLAVGAWFLIYAAVGAGENQTALWRIALAAAGSVLMVQFWYPLGPAVQRDLPSWLSMALVVDDRCISLASIPFGAALGCMIGAQAGGAGEFAGLYWRSRRAAWVIWLTGTALIALLVPMSGWYAVVTVAVDGSAMAAGICAVDRLLRSPENRDSGRRIRVEPSAGGAPAARS